MASGEITNWKKLNTEIKDVNNITLNSTYIDTSYANKKFNIVKINNIVFLNGELKFTDQATNWRSITIASGLYPIVHYLAGFIHVHDIGSPNKLYTGFTMGTNGDMSWYIRDYNITNQVLYFEGLYIAA